MWPKPCRTPLMLNTFLECRETCDPLLFYHEFFCIELEYVVQEALMMVAIVQQQIPSLDKKISIERQF